MPVAVVVTVGAGTISPIVYKLPPTVTPLFNDVSPITLSLVDIVTSVAKLLICTPPIIALCGIEESG